MLVAMRGRRVPALARRLAGRGRRMLDVLGLGSAELSLVLVSDRVMHDLNRDWRGKDRPTDVLAFAQNEAGPAPDGLLGDVVISVDTARRQATSLGHSLVVEVDRLLVHGLLHLLGYDHERSPAEARRMQRKERAVLRAIDA